jgi:hypothetical protein
MPYNRGMKRSLALALVLLAAPAWADDFSARAIAGRTVTATPLGNEFAQSIRPLLDEVATECDPPGTVLPASELGAFDLVGDITPAGVLLNVQVLPVTPLTTCFAAKLATHAFNPPPRPGNYPLYVHLTVTN